MCGQPFSACWLTYPSLQGPEGPCQVVSLFTNNLFVISGPMASDAGTGHEVSVSQPKSQPKSQHAYANKCRLNVCISINLTTTVVQEQLELTPEHAVS